MLLSGDTLWIHGKQVIDSSRNLKVRDARVSANLQVNGSISLQNLQATVPPGGFNFIGITPDTHELIAVLAPSTIRYKSNIRDLEVDDDKFAQLRPVRFNLKREILLDQTQQTREHIGLIAEEVETVYPEFVTYETDGKTPKGLEYDKIVALLIAHVQKQQAQITQLQRQITAKTND